MTEIASFLLKPFKNINKYSVQEEKYCLLFSNISFLARDIQVFKICKFNSQVMMSYTQPNFDQIWWRSRVLAVLLYGCKTWQMIKSGKTKLRVFLQKCLRRILKIYWPMKVTNKEIRFKMNMEEITQRLKHRRWKLIRHVLKKSVNKNTRIALTWTPEGRHT